MIGAFPSAIKGRPSTFALFFFTPLVSTHLGPTMLSHVLHAALLAALLVAGAPAPQAPESTYYPPAYSSEALSSTLDVPFPTSTLPLEAPASSSSTSSAAASSSTVAVAPTVHLVQVGANGLTYTPNFVIAAIGDHVVFGESPLVLRAPCGPLNSRRCARRVPREEPHRDAEHVRVAVLPPHRRRRRHAHRPRLGLRPRARERDRLPELDAHRPGRDAALVLLPPVQPRQLLSDSSRRSGTDEPTQCVSGMGFGINPPATGNTIDAFLAKAQGISSLPVWTETATAKWTGAGIAGTLRASRMRPQS